ncbi:MAG: biopolymer transporter ExbD, partial [Chitinophagaceae bacterium]
FLLITFFIFTTTMSSPSAMKLPFPDDTAQQDEQQKVAESGVWTIIIIEDNANLGKYLFYPGRLASDGSNLYSLKDPEIQNRLKEVMNLKANPTIRDLILYGQNQAKNVNVDYVLVVKPLNESHFKDVVSILDEVLITDVAFYTLQKIQDQELVLVKQKLRE